MGIKVANVRNGCKSITEAEEANNGMYHPVVLWPNNVAVR